MRAAWRKRAFLEIVDRLGTKSLLLGSDHSESDVAEGSTAPSFPVAVAEEFRSLEMLRLLGCPPIVFGLPSGSVSGAAPSRTRDFKTVCMAHIAFGMKGFCSRLPIADPDGMHPAGDRRGRLPTRSKRCIPSFGRFHGSRKPNGRPIAGSPSISISPVRGFIGRDAADSH